MSIDYSQFVQKRAATSAGSVHLLVDAYYPGPEIIQTGKGPRNFHRLLLLFYRTKKDGTPCTRWRAVTVSTKNPEGEFSRFFTALTGSQIKLGTGQILDYKPFLDAIIDDIRVNEYNFRLQWEQAPEPYKISIIGQIVKLNKVLIPRKAYYLWPKSALEKYPALHDRNESMYGGSIVAKLDIEEEIYMN
jgi:hypothetical protein